MTPVLKQLVGATDLSVKSGRHLKIALEILFCDDQIGHDPVFSWHGHFRVDAPGDLMLAGHFVAWTS